MWRAAALLGVGLAGGGAAIAVASIPDSNGVIHACYATDGSGAPTNGGAPLTVIDPSAGQSCNSPAGAGPGRRELDWNVPGPQGPPGPPGADGRAATVVSGQTLTLSGGQVIRIGGQPSGVPTQSAPVGGKPIATLTLGKERGAPSFEIRGFSFTGPGGSSATSGAGAGKVKFNEFQVTKKIDQSSPLLLQDTASGRPVKQVTVTYRKAGGKSKGHVYLVYKFMTAYVTSIQQSSAHGEETPTETITFQYGALSVNYHR